MHNDENTKKKLDSILKAHSTYIEKTVCVDILKGRIPLSLFCYSEI